MSHYLEVNFCGLSFCGQEEISFLKRQNVFRSLSFSSSLNDTEDVQDDASTRKLSIEQLPTDDLIQFESKGTVRLSTKQVSILICAVL